MNRQIVNNAVKLRVGAIHELPLPLIWLAIRVRHIKFVETVSIEVIAEIQAKITPLIY